MAHRFFKGTAQLASRNHQLFRAAAVVGTATTLSGLRYRGESSTRCDVVLSPPEIPIYFDEKQVPKLATPSLKENMENGVRKVRNFIRYLYRFLTISTLTAPMAILGPAAYVAGDNFPLFETLAINYCVWAMEMLGPAFVKLGQWASARPDLYSPNIIDKLRGLQDNVRTHHTMRTVEATLTDSFGPEWRDRLTLDPKPIGAGCIAQVYRGELKGEEKAVAVKVIHPHVEEMLRTDMDLLGFIADLTDKMPQLEILSLGDSLRNFSTSMTDQIDMKLEASNLIFFKEKWANEKWASFPTPIEGMITKNVLVETLMEGEPIEKFMQLKDTIEGKLDQAAKDLKKKLSLMGSRSMIKMIFFDNFIHGDMHPGNILVKMNKDGEPHLVFLDCGIVFSSKTEAEHNALVEICIAFMQHDGRKAARLMMDNAHSKQEGGSQKDTDGEKKFIESIQDIVNDCENHNYFEHIGEYVTRICNLAREYHVKLDPGYFHVAMALKVAEGMSLTLNKELDMVSECLPVIVKAKAYQAMGMKNFSMEKVAEDLEKERIRKKLAEDEVKTRARGK